MVSLGISLVPPLGPGLWIATWDAPFWPRWSFGTFCPCTPLGSERRTEAGQQVTQTRSLGTRPAVLSPARLQRPATLGSRAYPLPGGRYGPTLRAPHIPEDCSRASSPTPRSSGRLRPPRLQLGLRAPACARGCSALYSWAPPPLGSLPTRPPAQGRGGPPRAPAPAPQWEDAGDAGGRNPPVGRSGLSGESGPCLDSIYSSSLQAGSPAPYL